MSRQSSAVVEGVVADMGSINSGSYPEVESGNELKSVYMIGTLFGFGRLWFFCVADRWWGGESVLVDVCRFRHCLDLSFNLKLELGAKT